MKSEGHLIFHKIIIYSLTGITALGIAWFAFISLPSGRLQRAEKAIQTGEYNQALELVYPLRKMDEYNSQTRGIFIESHYQLGKELYYQEEPEDALEKFLKIPEDSERYIDTLKYLVPVYADLQDWRQVLLILEKHSELFDFSNENILFLLGKANFVRYREEQAQEIFESILAQNPYHQEALKYLALIYGRAGYNDLALSLVNRALQVSPESRDWLMFQGALLAQKHESSNALRAFDEFLENDPSNSLGQLFWLMVAQYDENADQEKVQKYLTNIIEADLRMDISFFLREYLPHEHEDTN